MKSTIKSSLPTWNFASLTFCVIALTISVLLISCANDDDENVISENPLCLVEIDGNFEAVDLDEMPVYLQGGHDGFIQALSDEISYPTEARENGNEGVCIINYEITTQGTVENITVIQDPGGGIGESTAAAIDSVTVGISFSPGVLDGNSVRVRKGIDIRFELQ